MIRRSYYSMGEFKDFYYWMSRCPENERKNFKISKDEKTIIYLVDGYEVKNRYGPHRWTDHRWLGESRVWFERCILCGAIRFWRGNDTVYIEPEGFIRILEHKERWDMPFIKKVLKEADNSELMSILNYLKYKEEWDAFVKNLLKEMKTND